MSETTDPHADAKAVLAAYFESVADGRPPVQPSNIGWPKVAAYVRDLEQQNAELKKLTEDVSRWRIVVMAMAVLIDAATGLKSVAGRLAKIEAEMAAAKEKGGTP